MTENPEEWKTAVDPNTGRTYWYHRKTRVSSWTKPNFRENAPDLSIPQQPIVTNPKISVSNSQYEQQPKPHSPIIQTSVQSVNQVDSGVLRFIPNSNTHNIDVQLHRLFENISATSADELSDNGDLLGDLVTHLLTNPVHQTQRTHQPHHTLNMKFSSTLLALKCIWKLSLSRIVSSTMFQLNQSWTCIWDCKSIHDNVLGGLVVSCIWSNLCIGPTVTLLPTQSLQHLESMLDSYLDKYLQPKETSTASLDLGLEGCEFVLDESCMGWYATLAQYGHVLPALAVLVMAVATLRYVYDFMWFCMGYVYVDWNDIYTFFIPYILLITITIAVIIYHTYAYHQSKHIISSTP
ncbi:hypothetical protein EON63_11955 [archaeon]|nr:MAG: hypothetical protein EON63_11955 [archaeon]